ncbi:MAG: hypothetical protein WC956_10805, partial [bacterium]
MASSITSQRELKRMWPSREKPMSEFRRIIVAKSAGFCWGVQRAFTKVLDVAVNHAAGLPVYTYGPLIHNPQAV